MEQASTAAGERSVTRGYGLLEAWLARRRAAVAERLISDAARGGAVLDVGCGTFPYFLTHTRFARRVGIDRHAADHARSDPAFDGRAVELHNHDFDHEDRLPFEDGTFETATMLAVFEHLRPDRLTVLLGEIHRVLRPGGRLILTTPAGWTEPILAALARLRMVSAVEIGEHHACYSRAMIRGVFAQTPFASDALTFGAFEAGLNTWAVAEKRPSA